MNNKEMMKTAKMLDKVLKIIQGFTVAGVIVCIIFVGLTQVFKDSIIADNSSIDLGNITLNLTEKGCALIQGSTISFIISSLVVAGCLCGVAWYLLKVVREVLQPMKQGTPFVEGTSGKIRKLGYCVIASGVIIEVGRMVMTTLETKAIDFNALINSGFVKGYTVNYTFNGSFLVGAFILFLLAYVFQYGEQLQVESDETL